MGYTWHFLTGPNASGKTTLLKTTALNVIFSQQFGCGFYDAATILPYTHIDSYLNIPDTSERDSLFQAESRRCKEILEKISDSSENDRHLCIFDELYSGTNCKDAVETATAFLKYLSSLEKVDFVLTTHYTKLCKRVKGEKNIKNYKMHVLQNKKEEDGGLVFTYEIHPGISFIKGALHILREMEYPQEILDEISREKK